MLLKISQAIFLFEFRTTLCNPIETTISKNITKIRPYTTMKYIKHKISL